MHELFPEVGAFYIFDHDTIEIPTRDRYKHDTRKLYIE